MKESNLDRALRLAAMRFKDNKSSGKIIVQGKQVNPVNKDVKRLGLWSS